MADGWETAPAEPVAKTADGWEGAPTPVDSHPRWDLVGDIGRAASESYSALKQDLGAAFPSLDERQARNAETRKRHEGDTPPGGALLEDLGRDIVETPKRMGAAARSVLDALGIVSSPLTGAATAGPGSLLSYLPGINKEQADEGVKQAMMGVRALPPGVRAADLASAAGARQAAADASAGKPISRRFGEDVAAGSPSAQDVFTRMQEAKTAGKPLAIADIAGENTRGLLGNVARQPGPARTLATTSLRERDSAAGVRLSGDIDKYVATGSAKQTTDRLLQERSAAARPLYDQVHQLHEVWSPRLAQFTEDPAIKSGLSRGYELERLDALAEGRPFEPKSYGLDIAPDGSWVTVGTPKMRVLDMAKRGLDAMIADERDPLTGRMSARGVSLSNVRRAYLDEIERLDTTGLYKKARESWAGPSASLDAIRAGRTMFSRSPEEIAQDFERLSASDKGFFRVGVADKLKERLGKTALSGDEAKKIINSDWAKKQLRPLFESENQYQEFVKNVATEGQMFETKTGVLGNSLTAARRAEDAGSDAMSMGMHAARAGQHLMSSNPLGAIAHLWRLKRDLGLRPNPQTNEQIARILLDPAVNFGPDSSAWKMLTQLGATPPPPAP